MAELDSVLGKIETKIDEYQDTIEQQKRVIEDLSERVKQGDADAIEQQRKIAKEVFVTEFGEEAYERKIRFDRDSDKELMGTKFQRLPMSIADVEMTYDVLTSAKRAGLSSGPSEELERTFKNISEALYLPEDEVRRIDQRALDNVFPRVRKGTANRAEHAAYQRAMDSAETGYGLQLIGAQYVADLWEGARPDSRVFSLLNSFEMTDPTAYLPVEADLPEMQFVAESTANNSSNYGTVKTGSNRVQVDAKKFVLHQMWSGEIEEDSIIPFIPFLRKQASRGIAHYYDALVLNGDTTNTATDNINLDDADPADTKYYLAFDGIRHASLVDNTANSLDMAGAVTFNALLGQRIRMLDRTYNMDWGHPTDPNDLVYIGTPEDGDAIAKLDEFVTVDKFGSNATVLTGQVGRIGQHPLITSIAMSLTEADGKVSNTGSNNTLGQIVAFNRRGYVVGWRRRIKLETERLPATDQTRLVYSMRLGMGRFSPTGAASGIEHTDLIYNITV